MLAIEGGNATIQLWDMHSQLTLDEWRQYLGALPYRQICPGTG
jgi:hypothetical protein